MVSDGVRMMGIAVVLVGFGGFCFYDFSKPKEDEPNSTAMMDEAKASELRAQGAQFYRAPRVVERQERAKNLAQEYNLNNASKFRANIGMTLNGSKINDVRYITEGETIGTSGRGKPVPCKLTGYYYETSGGGFTSVEYCGTTQFDKDAGTYPKVKLKD